MSETLSKSNLTFAHITSEQKQLLLNWLAQDHIQEWLHGDGLQNTRNDLEKFFKGPSLHEHWIAYSHGIPFAYLMTSEIAEDESDFFERQEEGKAITLDLFICDRQFMGKGLAVPMIQEFLTQKFSHAVEVFIDPEATNARAIHVYEKAGFKIVGQFIATWHPVPHYKMRLSMKELIQDINGLKPPYSNLCTEFYDLTKPEAGPREIAFYEALLKTANGPVLEAMCGSGRLLIPLLRRGIVVEGVDSSNHMLDSCKKRCEKQGLDVLLYNQTLQTLSLPKKYDLIFIAIGSFQLIKDDEEALQTLCQLQKALLPSGRLVLETYVPWNGIKENIQGFALSDQSPVITSKRIAQSSEGSKIVNKSTTVAYFKEQVEKTQTRYEKWIDGQFSHAEEEEYTIRWYYRFELKHLLEKEGFSLVEIIDTSFEQNEQAVIYIASKYNLDR